jgi:hypothetical protein
MQLKKALDGIAPKLKRCPLIPCGQSAALNSSRCCGGKSGKTLRRRIEPSRAIDATRPTTRLETIPRLLLLLILRLIGRDTQRRQQTGEDEALLPGLSQGGVITPAVAPGQHDAILVDLSLQQVQQVNSPARLKQKRLLMLGQFELSERRTPQRLTPGLEPFRGL